ncbi:CDP-alcohol phosphatidyltransferase family protein [Candidatus Parcubacteria bacterium]|jgi:CDP-diacylglycerol---glycerol-3-phosphate 3-phosphatidyltransferase|nr:CDP-alcohol phosphatidyltransferase family protein [Candidatus Parcubacteria bacterium]MBT3949399.1 CDP-alcohol phosphatidyltransferase family protein [Candidatus Parcubacteria bacterium]
MGIIDTFRRSHKDLFVYLPADEVHAHDHFLERTCLRWLPKFVTPNQISIFRIFFTPVVFFLILYGCYKTGVVLFLFNAFTDALDGSLARTKNQITKFGMMIDPLADKLLIGSMVLLLVFKHLNPWLGIAVLGIEIIFIVSAYVATTKFKNVRMANLWGKIKMVLQVVAVGVILIALVFEMPIFLNIASGILGLSIGFALVSLFRHGI